jgi:hypothetical protein
MGDSDGIMVTGWRHSESTGAGMTTIPEWPTFSEQYKNADNPGLLFHEFIGELFGPKYRNRPGFATFLSAGKDGAIDCFHADGEVWECKFIGAAGYAAALGRWNEVKNHLLANLLDTAPKSSQYQPWYNTDTPIQRYYFCTSNTLENGARLEELQNVIKADFVALAKRVGLKHLAKIDVEVWSWNRLGPELQHYPHLRLKWFPNPVPPVFKTLAMWMRNYSQGFRTYLTEDVLPYVALPDAELAPAQILATFLASGQPCSVLTGIGGAGKSRLLAETAALAQKEGWLVYMPGNNLTAEDISKLARLLGDGPVFIGLDYLEKCAQFEQVLDVVVQANESGQQIFLLATCRQSYWQQIDNLAVRQYALAQLDLQQVVRSILGPGLQEFAEECRNVPVFAAFVRFLAANKQDVALAELRAAPDFTTWLIDHILKSGNAANALRPFDQARLMVMLPASEAALKQLARELPALAAWRSVLEEDGWLLAVSDAEAEGGLLWQSAHDVIADGTVLRALATVGTRQANAVRLLTSARVGGAVPAALQALQRIAREANAQGIDWLQVFAAEKQAWGGHVEAVLASRLLGLEACFPFLQWYQADAAQLVMSDTVQGTLGFVTRALVKGWLILPQVQEAALLPWLAAAVQVGGKFNFVLTQALRWRPAQFKAAALQWLQSHPPEYQTHFLLTAWLNAADALGDVAMGQEVGAVVTAWLAEFARYPTAGYVTVAWLNAKQDPALVKDAISHWLVIEKNRIAPEAQFIFKAWLDAQQDAGVVKEALIAWLAVPQNRIAPEAQFVLKAWLDAQQDAGVVKEAVIAWLAVAQNRIAPEASFVFRAWLGAQQDTGVVKEALIAWLAVPQNRIAPEADFVFKGWLDAKQDAGVVKEALIAWLAVEQNRIAPETSFVFKAWLDAKQDAGVVKEALIAWLAVAQNRIAPAAQFVFKAWLDAKQAHALIEPHVLAWLAHGNNSTDHGADFIFRAWGDRLKRLENTTMFHSACRWLQANCHHADAAYCMKYIAGDRRLDQATASAIITWLTTFPTHEEAPGRLYRLHFNALSHCPSEALTTLYAAVLANYIKPAHRFGEFDVKTSFNLFFHAVRIAKRPTLHQPSRVPLACLFCQFLRQLNITQIQHIYPIIQHFCGGALPGLIRLGLQNSETFDAPLANSTRQLMQAYASLGELGTSDAALLRQILEKQPGK